MARVLIGLGSNIEPEPHLRSAAAMLRSLWSHTRFSRVVESDPVGFTEQNPFLNAVARVETRLRPEGVHAYLRTIERRLGKATPFTFGPRTIDLDLLLYDDLSTTISDLIIPHPRMHERRFVLEPLCDLVDPLEVHPSLQKTWAELLHATNEQHVTPAQLTL